MGADDAQVWTVADDLGPRSTIRSSLMASEVAGAVRGAEAPKTKVFISYSRKNMAFADRLEAALKERGLELLIDRAEI
jgi:hypothetical protein